MLNKYKVQSKQQFEYNDNSFNYANSTSKTTSPETKTVQTKHWVEKTYKPQDVIQYLMVNTASCYISRIMYYAFDMPKNKFNVRNSGLTTISRITAFQDIGNLNTVKALNLYYIALMFVGTKLKHNIFFSGLLKSIASRILLNDWDNKPNNYACYPKDATKSTSENTEFSVHAFDWDFSLGYKHYDFSKTWSYKEIRDIILGGEERNPAKALLETIGTLGTRTSKYYGIRNNYNDYINLFIPSLLQELSAINPTNHSLALIQLFRTMIKQIREHEERARENTKKDTKPKVKRALGSYVNVAEEVSGLLTDNSDKLLWTEILNLTEQEIKDLQGKKESEVVADIASLTQRAIDNTSKRLLETLTTFEEYLIKIEQEIIKEQQRHGNANCYNPQKPNLGKFTSAALESKGEEIRKK